MPKPPLILLVEDRDDDVVLIKHAFERARSDSVIQVANEGEDAMQYLSGTGKYANRDEHPLPWLVLLDLKMPRMDGFELLQWIRRQEGFKSIIVIVLTSSEQLKDVNQAYALGANSFMVKPFDFQNTIQLARLVDEFWLRHNRFPDATRAPRRPLESGPGTNGGKSG